MPLIASEMRGKKIVFLLVIEWAGKEYLLSTKPIVLSSSRGDLNFKGGLVNDPDITLDLGDLGFNVDGNSTAIAAQIDGVNVAKEILRGNALQNSKGALYYVFEDLKSIQSFDDASPIIAGKIKQPVYGHIDMAKGYVEFSIEAPSFNGDLYAFVSNGTGQIEAIDYSDIVNPLDSPFASQFGIGTTIIDVPEAHLGKRVPIIIGTGGVSIDAFGAQFRYAFSPCYVLGVNTSGDNKIWLAIASHYVDCSSVYIFDKLGDLLPTPVLHWVRRDGSIFAYVTFDLKAGGINLLQNIVEDSSAEYYVQFESDSGGLISSIKPSFISGGGELCIEFLKLGNAEIDFAEWLSLEPVLNKYKFGGYINQDDITPLEFLENEIIPFLPISVIHGPNGLKPVLNFLYSGSSLLTKYEINSDSDFYQNGPVQTMTDSSDIINHFTLQYQFNPSQNKYVSVMRLGSFKDNYTNQFSNLYAKLSQQKYGINKSEELSNYIHDETTAALVCADKIRFNSGSLKAIVYIANVKYGYIDLGDILLLNDQNLFDEPRKVQVIRKEFNGTNWLFTIKVEEDLINDFIS
tara:strand:- start:1711 stop:3429 length:1719 start_codon:yes stop_codon:yes gene_type:complete